MRLTTKIFIGFLGGVLASIIGGVFFVKTLEQDSIPDEQQVFDEIDFDAYKRIQINTDVPHYQVGVTIRSVATDKIQISRNYSTNIEKKRVGDRLILNLKVDNLEESTNHYKKNYIDVVIPAKQSLDLSIKAPFLSIVVDSVKMDELTLNMVNRNEITIQNTTIDKLVTKPYGVQRIDNLITYMLRNAEIGQWTMVANNVNYWNSIFEDSHIDVLNISGFRDVRLPAWSYKELNWAPLEEKAKLIVELSEKSTIKVK